MTVRQQSPQIRQSIERLSLRPAAYLRHLPRWLPPVVIAALFVGGLAVHGWGGAAMLLVVTVFLAWLALLSWPTLQPATRLLRVVALAVLLVLSIWQGLR
ncbi:MAG: hypothetical protein QOG05_2632 [Streptosporangiaceae bacterium]|nr:hypothetical protein [Streptosporangiaceae bacterium]